MAKFYGEVGYALTEQTKPDIWEETLVEQSYYGDSLNLMSLRRTTDNPNEDIELNCEISIVADPFALENFQFIRYVKWNNVKWKVKHIKPQYPRLLLTVGGVYNE